METSVLGKRRVGDEFTGPQKSLMRKPIMDVATEADLQQVTGVDSPMLDDRTLRQMGNERPYKLINKNSSMSGLGNADADLGDNPFGLDLDEPLPQEGGRKSRRNKRSNKSKTNKSKSHKKMGGKKTRRNKKGSRRNRK